MNYYRRYNFQANEAIANISGKFTEILNFWKIYNPTKEQWTVKVLRIKTTS